MALGLIPLFISGSIFAQDRWSWIHPLPQGNNLNAVAFSSPTHGFAAGDGGAILRTTDGGKTWENQSLGYPKLWAIQFPGKDTGYAVGDSGAAYRTADAGLRWTKLATGVPNGLRALHFLDGRIGFAGGDSGILIKTVDGGESWARVTTGSGSRIQGIHFPTPLVGFLTDSRGGLYRSEDGGAHWAAPIRLSRALSTVYFADADTGWVLGDTAVFRSTDGGRGWVPVLRVPDHSLIGAHFGKDALLAVSDYGGLYRSEDGGRNWATLAAIPESPRRAAISLAGGNVGISVGEGGMMHKTEDGGKSWRQLSNHVIGNRLNEFYSDFSFPNVRVGYFSTLRDLIKTTDGGATWSRTGVPSDFKRIHCHHFFDDTLGLVAGAFPGGTAANPADGFLERTSDGGKTWTPVRHFPGLGIDKMEFPTPEIGYITGARGAFKTRDKGLTWDSIAAPSRFSIKGMQFLDTSRGFAWTSTAVYGTSNGGLTWDSLPLPRASASEPEYPFGMHFLDRDVGFIPVARGMLKTTDGGKGWRMVNSVPFSISYQAIHFPSRTVGYAVGVDGFVQKTVDGGETWSRVNVGAHAALLGIAFPDTGRGFVGGVGYSTAGSLVVLKVERNPGEVSIVARGPEGDFRLEGDGLFSYRLESPMRVTAELFDNRGRKVASVLDRIQGAGRHRASLGDSSLPRGAYLLRFRAGGMGRSVAVQRL